jgi:hypothetical protein
MRMIRRRIGKLLAGFAVVAMLLQAAAPAGAVTTEFKFLGPVSTWPWNPECGKTKIVDPLPGAVLIHTVAWFSDPATGGSCASVLARPADWLTVDSKQTTLVNGAACANTAVGNGANFWFVFTQTGCPNGPIATFRSSHWYKYNGLWYRAICNKNNAGAAATCAIG